MADETCRKMAMESATAIKVAGNELFTAKQWELARGKYTAALDALPVARRTRQQSADDAATERELRATLLSNRAACLLQLKLFAEASADCDAALATGPATPAMAVKIWNRKAQALRALADVAGAADALAAALALDPKARTGGRLGERRGREGRVAVGEARRQAGRE